MKYNWAHVSWYFSRKRRLIKRKLCGRFYHDRSSKSENSILIAGTGRSGTTWLAELIASQLSSRILFEPFNPELVEAYQSFNYFQYMQPEEEDDRLHNFCERIFRGELRDPWIDRQVEQIFPAYRLVKTIRGTLLLRWIHDRFPEVPILYIMRHPCAVVQSQRQLQWSTDKDINVFLEQPKLMEDYLSDKMEIIEEAATPEEKYAVLWCITNLIPLQQFRDANLPIFFYEHLLTQPEKEIPKIFQTINQSFQLSVFDRINRPSDTTLRSSAVITGADPVAGWKQALMPSQVKAILAVVEAFGLGHLYGEDPLPLIA